ncbi:rhythmically expressed gene 5 protein [Contarinia nasturtii]|uniref:rhythmically expressed gene 5 protein n=1 Tax=Contarinia nasturtii TaxID=265458 RepID=UPI0012D47D3D|nr:rhythmically expressed gene 5 protein [Contarinia nasturtii]
MAKLFYTIVVLTTLLSMCSGSAIPMWEFFGRNEKMSYLYSMFAKEVSKYCKSNADTVVPKCKHDLLSYGVAKLEQMNESHLDAMDPYQRSANDIIWDSIMDGHPMMQGKKEQTTKAPIRQPTGLFERNPLFDGMDDDDDVVAVEQKKPKNDEKMINNKPNDKVEYSMDMDMSYGQGYEDPGNHLPFATNINYQYDLPAVNAPSNYLIGPMIVRVKPDGTPVDEDKTKPLPIDDDREAMTIGTGYFPSKLSSKLPSTHLEAPAAPNAQISSARIQPDTSVYTNYRTIARRTPKTQH